MANNEGLRPDVAAQQRGGDVEQGMHGEAEVRTAELEQAHFWQRNYADILAMEELVMDRIHELMAHHSPDVKREVETSNIPVIAAQIDRFRQRHQLWTERIAELED